MENKTSTEKEQDRKWFQERMFELIEAQKTELVLLTRRVTDLEVKNIKLIKWLKEKESGKVSEFTEQNLFSNEM